MKKILLLIVGALFAMTLSAQTDRMVFMEEYTNASCPPCAFYNPAYNVLIENNRDKVISIKYQTWFPGYDPYFYEAPVDIQAYIESRWNATGFGGVPTCAVDGQLATQAYANGVGNFANTWDGCPGGFNQAVINYAAGFESPIELEFTFEFDDPANPTMMNTNTRVVNAMPDSLDLAGHTLQVLMVEQENLWPFAPGTTDETDYYDVFRKTVTDATGLALSGKMGPGDTVNISSSATLPGLVYDFSQLGVVGFVSANSNGFTVQAGRALAKPVVGQANGSVTGNIIATGQSNCDYSAGANALIRNGGEVEITAAEVAILDSEGTAVSTESFSGSIMPGGSSAVTFSGFTEVAPGTNDYSINLVSVNGSRDYNLLDNFTSTVQVTKWVDDPVWTNEYAFDIENLEPTEIPMNSYVNRPRVFQLGSATTDWLTAILNGSGFPLNGPAGNNSSASIIVDFWRWDPGSFNPVGNLTFDKVALVDRMGTEFSFDYNHAQRGASNDRVEVRVSTDCGETFDVVWSKAGAELATTTTTTDFYTPRPADWVNEVVDLSAYDGFDGINVQFNFTSTGGNNVFIDNINLTSEMSTSTNEPNELESISMYPNPAVDASQVVLNLTEAVELNAQVTDIAGKVVEVLAQDRYFGVGEQIIDVNTSDYPAGVYFVKVSTNTGQTVKRLNVTK